ncbi:type II CAAX endopeptidase family protein [Paenibacillus sp. FSL R7-0179]|uniref:type II CAAX endopeptidase family protein n=1 Tax=Paenibacillus sp. FSL R7-0179 TaxID=2921672 RepID=UPI0030FB9D09
MSTIEKEKTVQSARRGLLVFFLILIPLTAISYILALTVTPVYGLLLMWAPGISSILTRILLREGFADISLRFGGQRTLRTTPFILLLPVAVGLVAYGTAWITGLTEYTGHNGNVVGALAGTILIQMSVGTVMGIISSAGEELGWRGYMLTRLTEAHVPKPILMSGLIWGIWHIPAILIGSYYSGPSLALSIVLFMVTISSFNIIISLLRLSTGSIWPAVLLHASWNAIIQDAFDRYTSGKNAYLWTGESGILVAATLVIAAWFFYRRSAFVKDVRL